MRSLNTRNKRLGLNPSIELCFIDLVICWIFVHLLASFGVISVNVLLEFCQPQFECNHKLLLRSSETSTLTDTVRDFCIDTAWPSFQSFRIEVFNFPVHLFQRKRCSISEDVRIFLAFYLLRIKA